MECPPKPPFATPGSHWVRGRSKWYLSYTFVHFSGSLWSIHTALGGKKGGLLANAQPPKRGDPVISFAHPWSTRSKVLNGTTIWQAQLEMVSDSSCCKHPNCQWSIVHLIVYLILLRTLYIYRSIDRYFLQNFQLSAIMHHLGVVDFHNMALHDPKGRVFPPFKTLQNTHHRRPRWNFFPPGVSGASLTSSTWRRKQPRKNLEDHHI